MRSEKLAKHLADGFINDSLNKETMNLLGNGVMSVYHMSDNSEQIKNESFELDGAKVRIVCNKYGELAEDVDQMLCARLGDRVIYYIYNGSENIEDYAQDFVDCLK